MMVAENLVNYKIMNLVSLINVEWNCYNGFFFEILHLDLNKPNIDGSLFGFGFSKDFLYIELFFTNFTYNIN